MDSNGQQLSTFASVIAGLQTLTELELRQVQAVVAVLTGEPPDKLGLSKEKAKRKSSSSTTSRDSFDLGRAPRVPNPLFNGLTTKKIGEWACTASFSRFVAVSEAATRPLVSGPGRKQDCLERLTTLGEAWSKALHALEPFRTAEDRSSGASTGQVETIVG